MLAHEGAQAGPVVVVEHRVRGEAEAIAPAEQAPAQRDVLTAGERLVEPADGGKRLPGDSQVPGQDVGGAEEGRQLPGCGARSPELLSRGRELIDLAGGGV